MVSQLARSESNNGSMRGWPLQRASRVQPLPIEGGQYGADLRQAASVPNGSREGSPVQGPSQVSAPSNSGPINGPALQNRSDVPSDNNTNALANLVKNTFNLSIEEGLEEGHPHWVLEILEKYVTDIEYNIDVSGSSILDDSLKTDIQNLIRLLGFAIDKPKDEFFRWLVNELERGKVADLQRCCEKITPCSIQSNEPENKLSQNKINHMRAVLRMVSSKEKKNILDELAQQNGSVVIALMKENSTKDALMESLGAINFTSPSEEPGVYPSSSFVLRACKVIANSKCVQCIVFTGLVYGFFLTMMYYLLEKNSVLSDDRRFLPDT